MTAKQVHFVDTPLDTNRQVAQIAMFDGAGTPVKPITRIDKATPTVPGLVKQAAYVDPTTGNISGIVTALVDAGIMAAK